MKKKKIAAVTVATAIAISSTNLVSVVNPTEAAGKVYKDGSYQAEAEGYYRIGDKRAKTVVVNGKKRTKELPVEVGLQMKVTFENDRIADIVLLNRPDVENDQYPDDPNYGSGAGATTGGWDRIPGFLMKRLKDSTDYEKDLVELLKKLNSMKNHEDRSKQNLSDEAQDLREELLEPDAISNATWTTAGMTEATLKAVRIAKQSAGETKAISNMELVNPKNSLNDKVYEYDDYDINGIEVKLTYSDNTTENVKYADFSSKNLKLEIEVDGSSNNEKIAVPSDGIIHLTDKKLKFTIKENKENGVSKLFTVAPQLKALKLGVVKYRVEGYKDFKTARIKHGFLTSAELVLPEDADRKKPIEIFVEKYFTELNNKYVDDPYMIITGEPYKEFKNYRIEGRGREAVEDGKLIEPATYSDGIKFDYSVDNKMSWEKESTNNQSDTESTKLKDEIKILKDKIKADSAKLGSSEEEAKLKAVAEAKLKNSNFDVEHKSTFQLRAIKYNLIKFAQNVKADVADVKNPEDVTKAPVGEKTPDPGPVNPDPNPGKPDPNPAPEERTEDKTGKKIGISLDDPGEQDKNFNEGHPIKPIVLKPNKGEGVVVESVENLPKGLKLVGNEIVGTPEVGADEWDQSVYNGLYIPYTLKILAKSGDKKYFRNYQINIARDRDRDNRPDAEELEAEPGSEKVFDAIVDSKPIVVNGKEPSIDDYKAKIQNLPETGVTVRLKEKPDLTKEGETKAVLEFVVKGLENEKKGTATIKVKVDKKVEQKSGGSSSSSHRGGGFVDKIKDKIDNIVSEIAGYKGYLYGGTNKGEFVEKDGKTKYVVNGKEQKDNWLKVDSEWYKVDKDGNIVKNNWIKESDKIKYYAKADGKIYRDTKFTVAGKEYYANKNGKVASNFWNKVGGYWHYAKADGSIAKNEWVKSHNRWYFAKPNGAITQNAWFMVNGKWYYADGSGAIMQNRWFRVNGKWYFAKSDGSLAVNQKVGKYRVNASGQRVR